MYRHRILPVAHISAQLSDTAAIIIEKVQVRGARPTTGPPTSLHFWMGLVAIRLHSSSEGGHVIGGGFFVTCEDLGRMVDNSFPAWAFFFLKWRLARTN